MVVLVGLVMSVVALVALMVLVVISMVILVVLVVLMVWMVIVVAADMEPLGGVLRVSGSPSDVGVSLPDTNLKVSATSASMGCRGK